MCLGEVQSILYDAFCSAAIVDDVFSMEYILLLCGVGVKRIMALISAFRYLGGRASSAARCRAGGWVHIAIFRTSVHGDREKLCREECKLTPLSGFHDRGGTTRQTIYGQACARFGIISPSAFAATITSAAQASLVLRYRNRHALVHRSHHVLGYYSRSH